MEYSGRNDKQSFEVLFVLLIVMFKNKILYLNHAFYMYDFADLKMPVMFHWKNTKEPKRLVKNKVTVGAFTLSACLAFSTSFLTFTQPMIMWRSLLMALTQGPSIMRLVT